MEKAFILGNPRSGTSLLRLILNAHPLISAAPESGFLHWWFTKYKHWSSADSSNSNSIANYISDLRTSKKIETWKLDFDGLHKYIEDKRPGTYADLGLSVYEFWALKNKKDVGVIIDKNNYYINHLDQLREIWADAKYIYIVRDGRDVACSYLNLRELETSSIYKPQLPTTIIDIAKEWIQNNTTILNFLESVSSQNKVIVRYEDLIAYPKDEIQRVLNLFNLSFRQELLSFFMTNDEPVETLDWKKRTFEPIDPNNSMKYKSLLTAAQIECFNGAASKLLTQFDYEV